jgi:hypothetical protein
MEEQQVSKNQSQQSPTLTQPAPQPKPAPAPKPQPAPPKKPATIENKNLIESILYLKEKKLIEESQNKIKFESTKEAEESKAEEVISIITEKTRDIKENISELEKSGKNLHIDSIKLISVPLKTKIWLSTYGRKDLENIFKILEEVKKVVDPLKQELDKKIQEKERLEKEADAKEASKNQAKTNPAPIAKQQPVSNKPKTIPVQKPQKPVQVIKPKSKEETKQQ